MIFTIKNFVLEYIQKRESELVSGFMTEHAAVIFVFFFLAEYASIVLICTLMSILFLGGYQLYPLSSVNLHLLELLDLYISGFIYNFSELISEIIDIFAGIYELIITGNVKSALYRAGFDITNLEFIAEEYSEDDSSYLIKALDKYLSYPLIEGILYGFALGLKTCIMIFVFIWVRASFPRIRFDQLMSFCWTVLLPLAVAWVIVIPCWINSLSFIAANVYLL